MYEEITSKRSYRNPLGNIRHLSVTGEDQKSNFGCRKNKKYPGLPDRYYTTPCHLHHPHGPLYYADKEPGALDLSRKTLEEMDKYGEPWDKSRDTCLSQQMEKPWEKPRETPRLSHETSVTSYREHRPHKPGCRRYVTSKAAWRKKLQESGRDDAKLVIFGKKGPLLCANVMQAHRLPSSYSLHRPSWTDSGLGSQDDDKRDKKKKKKPCLVHDQYNDEVSVKYDMREKSTQHPPEPDVETEDREESDVEPEDVAASVNGVESVAGTVSWRTVGSSTEPGKKTIKEIYKTSSIKSSPSHASKYSRLLSPVSSIGGRRSIEAATQMAKSPCGKLSEEAGGDSGLEEIKKKTSEFITFLASKACADDRLDSPRHQIGSVLGNLSNRMTSLASNSGDAECKMKAMSSLIKLQDNQFKKLEQQMLRLFSVIRMANSFSQLNLSDMMH